jgi:hypothetical protein
MGLHRRCARNGATLMTLDIDKRTKRGRELAQRLNQQTILDNMPKVYFVEDRYNGGYRVGRTDWPGDMFNIVPKAEFEAFRKVYEGINMPLIDCTDD